ncbi:MAG TPA: alpha/beta hydrolase-fold protein, partial [Steroidobacteraceae bacterium]|nr:alpha/beta hydrolase-fold protein [Steroidobacteraceae bacterium]
MSSAIHSIAINGLPEAEYFDLYSQAVGDTFRLFVAKPLFPQPGTCPAIFTTDGNGLFMIAAGIQRMLALGAECPSAYVVAIGYPTDNGFAEAMSKRGRDFAPTDGGEYARAILHSSAAAGGAQFLKFVTEELKPEIQSRYAVNPADSTYIGSSLGGLFGAWTLLTAPSTFQRYILASPTISWNNEEVWHWEEACARGRKELPARVFIAAGSLEAPEAARREALKLAEHNSYLRPQVESIIAWFDLHGWPRTTELP